MGCDLAQGRRSWAATVRDAVKAKGETTTTRPLLQEGKYDEAIEHYTTAVRLAPENPLLYTNRALALFKVERFASAETDCSAALSINPKLVKALYRRAQARKCLDKLDDAIADLKRVLDIEPRNSASLKDLSAWTGSADLRAGSVNSIYRLIDPSIIDGAVASSSFRRVPIAEVGTGTRPFKPPRKYVGASGDSFGVKSVPAASPGAKTGPVSPPSMLPTNPPTNWYQMERELRELAPSSGMLNELAVDYLCSIEPASYTSVIGQNLDSTCLGRLLAALAATPNPLSADQRADRLEALTRLPRFDVAWLLAEDADRALADGLLGQIPPDRAATFKKAFV